MGDKPRPDFSNVKSGSSTTAPKAATPKPAEAAPERYTVVSGDSLSKIAKKYYGDATQWRRIFEANRDRIEDPDLIQPGWELLIPPKA